MVSGKYGVKASRISLHAKPLRHHGGLCPPQATLRWIFPEHWVAGWASLFPFAVFSLLFPFFFFLLLLTFLIFQMLFLRAPREKLGVAGSGCLEPLHVQHFLESAASSDNGTQNLVQHVGVGGGCGRGIKEPGH